MTPEDIIGRDALLALEFAGFKVVPCDAQALLIPDLPDDFARFWSVWPHKVGKPAAERSWRAARKAGHSVETIMAGVETYIATKPKDRPWLNPATFLNQTRFLDRPAATSGTQSLRNTLRQEIENEQRQGQESRDLGYGGRLSFDGEPVHGRQLARLPARR